MPDGIAFPARTTPIVSFGVTTLAVHVLVEFVHPHSFHADKIAIVLTLP